MTAIFALLLAFFFIGVSVRKYNTSGRLLMITVIIIMFILLYRK